MASEKGNDLVVQANQNLDRMKSSLGSSQLSDLVISSEGGKLALSEMLATAASGEFSPSEARAAIKAQLKLQ